MFGYLVLSHLIQVAKRAVACTCDNGDRVAHTAVFLSRSANKSFWPEMPSNTPTGACQFSEFERHIRLRFHHAKLHLHV